MSFNNSQPIYAEALENYLFKAESVDNLQNKAHECYLDVKAFSVAQQMKQLGWNTDFGFNNQYVEKSQQAPTKDYQAMFGLKSENLFQSTYEQKETFSNFDIEKLLQTNGGVEEFINRSLLSNDRVLAKECDNFIREFEELKRDFKQTDQQSESKALQFQIRKNAAIANLEKEIEKEAKENYVFAAKIADLKTSKEKADALKKNVGEDHFSVFDDVKEYIKEEKFHKYERIEFKETDEQKLESRLCIIEKELKDLKEKMKQKTSTSNAGIQTDAAVIRIERINEQIDQLQTEELKSTNGLISQTFEPEDSDLNFQSYDLPQLSTSALRSVPRMPRCPETKNNSPFMRSKQSHHASKFHKTVDASKMKKVKREHDSDNEPVYTSSEESDNDEYEHGAYVPVAVIKREDNNDDAPTSKCSRD